MAVRGIDDDDVDAGVDQRFGPLKPRIADTGGGGDAQTALLVLAGVGVELGFFDILDRNQADAAVVAVDDQKFFDAVLVQDALGLFGINAVFDRDQAFVSHQLADRLIHVGGEAHVAVGQDAGQLAAALLDHRNAGNPVALHQIERIGQGPVGRNGHRIDDHAGFELLDAQDFRRLLHDIEIAMDHADAAGLGHGDRHAGFGHGVHGRGDQGNVEGDGLGQAGSRIGFAGQDGRGRRLEENVVESEGFEDFHCCSHSKWRAICHAALRNGRGKAQVFMAFLKVCRSRPCQRENRRRCLRPAARFRDR